MAIPVSTVALELAFSTSERSIRPHYSRLHADIIKVLMCAQNWISAPSKGMIIRKNICIYIVHILMINFAFHIIVHNSWHN